MTDALRRIDKVRQIRRAIGLTIGAAIYSAGLNLFLIPNHVIDGGVTGISLLIQALTGIPFSVLIVLLNVPFFYMGYKSLGPRLAASSMFAIIVLSLCSSRLEKMMPATNDPFLSTIFGGIIIGLGVGIVIKNGGSTDGTEIVAIWMDSRSSFSVGEIVMFFNFFILGAAGFVFSWNSAMYSLIAYFICSRMIDAVSTGLDSSKGIFIITTCYDDVSDAIVHDMHRAVTRLHGQGGFLKDDKDVLYCVISRLEAALPDHKSRNSSRSSATSIPPLSSPYSTCRKSKAGLSARKYKNEQEIKKIKAGKNLWPFLFFPFANQ